MKERRKPMFGNKQLAESISLLACVLREGVEQRKTEFEWYKSHAQLATKRDLDKMEERIMSAISDFAAKQKAHNERHDKAIGELGTSVQGVVGDIERLNKKIEELQNTSGSITPEDQKLLDEIEAAGDALATKLESTSAAMKALDDLTPPAPPSENPPGVTGPVHG